MPISRTKLEHRECAGNLSAVDDALYVIGGKWKLKIIITLSEGSQRFNELQRKVTGISARVLSNELKDLEMNGFVTRTVHEEASPIVIEYKATEYTDSLQDVLKALTAWGKMHRSKIKTEAEHNEHKAIH
jgi:DNA-binding HxlR family transcriptional regulator